MKRINNLVLSFVFLLVFFSLICSCEKRERVPRRVDAGKLSLEDAGSVTSIEEKENICLFIDISVPVRGYFEVDSKTIQLLKKFWDNSILSDENIYFDRHNLYGFGNEVKELYLNNINEILDYFTLAGSDIKFAFDFIRAKGEEIKCNNFLFITDLVVSQKSGINDIYDYANSIKRFAEERNYGLWIVGAISDYFGVNLKKSKNKFFFSETKDNRGGWVKMDNKINKPLYFLIMAKPEKGRKIYTKIFNVFSELFGKENIRANEIYPHSIDNDKLTISCMPSVKEVIITNGAKYTKDSKVFQNNLKLICKSKGIVTLNCVMNFADNNFNIHNRVYGLDFAYDKKYIDISLNNQVKDIESEYILPLSIKLSCDKAEESYKKAKSGFISINFNKEINQQNTSWWKEWSTDDDYKNYEKTLYLNELLRFLAKNNSFYNKCSGKGIEYKFWR